MTKEQYNSLAPYQKAMYDKCNKRNKGLLIAGWAVGGVMLVIMLIIGISLDDPIGGIGAGLGIGISFGGFFPGFAHLGFLFKKIGFGGAILLWIVLGIFILMVYGIIFMVVGYAGIVFFIIDTILFIMKKPLIYRWEDNRVLAKAAAQAVPFQSAPSAADQLNELNQMLTDGLITQEEFEAKKAEIMARM